MTPYIDISDFSGGVNTRDGAGGIADNELAESKNCYLVARGVAKRKGFIRYNGSIRINGAEEGLSITDAGFSSGAIIVGTAGTKIAQKGTNAWTDRTGSVSLTAEQPIITTMINDNLVGVNALGTDAPWYWSGSGNAAALTGDYIPATARTCETFAGRLMLANGRRLSWSGFMGDWNKFHPQDYQDFNENIIGLKIIGDSNSSSLMILCEKSVHKCTFSPETIQTGGRGIFIFDQISDSNGCAASASVAECYIPTVGYAIVWADYDGLKIYAPSIGIDKVTDIIRPDWEGLNLSKIAYFTGVHYRPKGWYILTCHDSGDTTNNKQIIFDLRNSKPYSPDSDRRWVIAGIFDWPISAFGVVKESGVEKLIGSDYSGYWNQYDNSQNDNGVAIDAYIKLKSYDGGYPQIDKGFVSVGMNYTYYGQFDIDITAYYEHLGDNFSVTHTTSGGVVLGTFVLDQDILGAAEQLVVTAEEIKGWGRTVQLKIGNNEIGQPFRIHGMRINYRPGREILMA